MSVAIRESTEWTSPTPSTPRPLVLLSEGIARWQGPMNILMRRPWPKDARFFSARIVGFVLPPSAAAPIKALRRDLRPLSKSPCVVTLMAMVLSDHRLAT